ncbi:MAG: aminotransferase class IV [Planctomycetota bacterium]
MPTDDVFLNGTMTPATDARVSLADAGLTHAVGLFETLAVRSGVALWLDEHLDRLAGSARELGLAESLDVDPLRDAVRQTVTHNGLADARLRLTVTGGTLSLLDAARGRSPRVQTRPTVAVVPGPLTGYDEKYYEQGITALIHGPAANPFDEDAGHKTLNYWARLRSLRRAAAAGAGEAIWLNVTNHLASGAVSNLMLVKDGAVLTPIARGEEVPEALRAPVLPGVTRGVVLRLAADGLGLEVKRKMLSVEDLLEADEAVLTNSGWGVLPVTKVERREIGGGKVGPVTRSLTDAYAAEVRRQTAADA